MSMHLFITETYFPLSHNDTDLPPNVVHSHNLI